MFLSFIFLFSVSILHADVIHVVKKGDTLFGIARKYGVTIKQVKEWNSFSSDKIQAGQKIVIKTAEKKVVTKKTPADFKYYKVKSQETLWRIAYNHGVPVKTIINLNNINDVSGIKPGQLIKIPSNAIEGRATGAGKPVMGNTRLQRPVPGIIYPSNNRNGINIVCSDSESVRCVLAGTVEYTGNLVGYRNVVIVNHENALYSVYAALGPVHVEKGQSVRKGQVIGNVNKLPHYEKPFLYFELVSGGTYLNPAKYIY